MNDWSNFFIGELGAAASLAGLLFVAVSVNQARILQLGRMADRGLEALVMLLAVVMIASMGLVPGQGVRLLGLEIFATAAAASGGIFLLERAYLRLIERPYRRLSIQMAVCNQLSLITIALGGLVTLWRGQNGLYLLPPGILATFLFSIANAWVLLIEINR
jgi:modulator of FtsH protease